MNTFEISPVLPPHCSPQNAFLAQLSSTLDICVPTTLAFISTLLGCLSIVSWLFAQLPQIVKNARLQSTAGLSVYFLVEWCLGDAANLAGAVLTSQATWQIVVAGYYVLVDVVLVAQYYFYSHYTSRAKEKLPLGTESYGRRNRGEGGFPDESASCEPSPTAGPLRRSAGMDGSPITSKPKPEDSMPRHDSLQAGAFSEKQLTTSRSLHHFSESSSHPPLSKALLVGSLACAALSNASPLPASSRLFLGASSSSTATSVDLGSIISWLSTLLYLCSRLPQIFKNHRRRSTAGLSPHLFAAAFCGNLFYSASLLANPLAWSSYPPYGDHGWAPASGSDRLRWLTLATPFWLGAAGVLLLDAIVGAQFLVFGDGEEHQRRTAPTLSSTIVSPGAATDDVDALARGRAQWRDLDGWMRGWVPSPTPSLRGIFWGTATDEQSPLLQQTEGTHARRSRPALRKVADSGQLPRGSARAYGST